jgi:hypothetical protein
MLDFGESSKLEKRRILPVAIVNLTKLVALEFSNQQQVHKYIN